MFAVLPKKRKKKKRSQATVLLNPLTQKAHKTDSSQQQEAQRGIVFHVDCFFF
jgi:predicted SPOUT superfamily RNA methylase MTH1